MSNYILVNGSLYHYGIKGQKWGLRNYQHEDGSYTDKGQQENQGHGRYASECEDSKSPKQLDRAKKSKYKITFKKDSNKINISKDSANKKKGLSDKQKKYIKIGLGVAATALVAYGGYQLYKNGNLIQNYANLGKKNVEFIRNHDIPTIKSELSKNLQDAYYRIKNDEYAPDVFDPEQVKLLNDDELNAIKAYTTPLYKEANAVLRGDGEGTQFGKAIAQGVSSALEKVSISKDVEVQRGINQSTCRFILGNDLFNELAAMKNSLGDNSGKVSLSSLADKFVNDNGIMSTAIPYTNSLGKKSSIADYFSGPDGIIFDIKAPEGSKGMYISPISEQKAEREIIFAPGSKINFNGDIQIIDGIIHVFGELAQ